MGDRLTDVFLQLFCEKNSDGTKTLRLRGKDLYQRIGTRLKDTDMHKLATFLREVEPNIVKLDLSYNDLGDKGIQILSENYLYQENNLKHLNLMHCDIERDGMKYLSSSDFLRLESCRINGNKLGPAGAQYIARLIEKCPTLLHIDIAETDLTLESIESILIVIEGSTLKILDLSRIIPKSYYTKFNQAILADDLAVVLKLNETLRELHIKKVQFDGHDIEILLTGLNAKICQLEVLDLDCNSMGDFGIQLIANWLKTRPSLRALIVSSNNIKDFGARALGFGLPFSKIRYLDISNNHIGDFGLMDLLDSIKKISQMRLFYIWGNTVGPVSCKRIRRMLASGVLKQEYVDVKIYCVDNHFYSAFYPANHYKHKYYCVMDHGCPVELKIKRNKIHHPDALPRELVKFAHVARYPPVDESLGLKVVQEKECPEHEEGNQGRS